MYTTQDTYDDTIPMKHTKMQKLTNKPTHIKQNKTKISYTHKSEKITINAHPGPTHTLIQTCTYTATSKNTHINIQTFITIYTGKDSNSHTFLQTHTLKCSLSHNHVIHLCTYNYKLSA